MLTSLTTGISDYATRRAIQQLASRLSHDSKPTFAGLTIAGESLSNSLITQWSAAYSWGDHAGLYDAIGTAAAAVDAHELAYDHTLLHNPVTLGTDNGLTLDDQELSLPTTASPTFAGLTLSGLTASRLTATNGSKGLASVSDLTAWVAGTANEIDVASDGDGTITIGLVNPLIVGKGGTGVATLTTAYGLLAAGTTATGAVQTLAAGLTTQILVGGGAAALPAWGADIPTAVTIGSAYIYRAGGTDVPVADGGTGASTLTDHSILLGSGTDAITPLGAASDGQLPIGSSGADPVLATLTGTAGQIAVTNGAGTITLALTGNMDEIAALTPTDSNIIVGNGTTWVAESGATARTSLGLGTADSVTFADVTSTAGASFTKTVTSSGHTGTSLYLTVDTSAGDLTYGTGCKFRAICSGANNLINGLIGAYGTASHEGSGTVAIGRGVVGLNQTTAGGTITAAWDFYANPPGVSGGGAIGSSGGVYIAAQKITGVTTGYGIYQVGADDINNFVGKCKFGTSGTPAENVHASDTVRADIAFNLNGTDGVTQAASAGTVCDVTALAGGIATAQTQVTYIADGAHSLSGITSITTVNGRITAMA